MDYAYKRMESAILQDPRHYSEKIEFSTSFVEFCSVFTDSKKKSLATLSFMAMKLHSRAFYYLSHHLRLKGDLSGVEEDMPNSDVHILLNGNFNNDSLTDAELIELIFNDVLGPYLEIEDEELDY